MRIKCYIHGIFPAYYDVEKDEIVGTYPLWSEPFLDLFQFFFNVMAVMMKKELLFPIHFYGKNKEKFNKHNKTNGV
ncbi:MAG: hypothetical protein M0R06_02000 [Sphaerochaeta sp.]|jgi:hypothetical protein|nr:hypothetical protein [Sphaerochaeta sp.]